MISQTVVLLFLCGCYVNCAYAKTLDIDKIEWQITRLNGSIDKVMKENRYVQQHILNLEWYFKKNVTELEIQNAIVSEEVLKKIVKIKKLYVVLTKVIEKKKLLHTEIKELQHWIEVRNVGIMFMNQDIEVYNWRIGHGYYEKCLQFQVCPVLLVEQPDENEDVSDDEVMSDNEDVSDDDLQLVFLRQTELNQSKSTLTYLQSVQKEEKLKLDQLTLYYKLKIDNLIKLLERNIGDEERARETVKIFETQIMELNARISELELEKNHLIKEQEKLSHKVDDIRGTLLKIKEHIVCFRKLEQTVLNTTPLSQLILKSQPPLQSQPTLQSQTKLQTQPPLQSQPTLQTQPPLQSQPPLLSQPQLQTQPVHESELLLQLQIIVSDN
ncbi:hypothetical protein J6590_086751 [Homalodisca vitripennis]|nr:hypothetical protein J6590_086751 [Homalodisca vitripennis]